jgi:putative DNA primase/helicase
MNLVEVLSRFRGVRRVGNGYMALCPAHADKSQSLSATERDGKVLLYCHAGCSLESILGEAGVGMHDLFTSPQPTGNGADGRRIVETYDYTDEKARLLFQVVRYEPKQFRQRRPDGRGGWLWNLQGVRRVLYNVLEIAEAQSVLVLEGEKDCGTARKLGMVATTNPGGAGRWRPEFNEPLRGKRVAIICDADTPGLAHGWHVGRSLFGIAASVRVIERLPESKDLAEFVEHGGTREQLLEIIRATPELTPADLVERNPADQIGSGFMLTRLGDLLSKPGLPVEYIWDGRLVAGTVSGLVGKPKVGKGTLARNLFLAVARGEAFLGLPTRQGECIYLALEEREEDIRADFAAMGADGREPILIHAAAAPSEGIRALCELVRERRPRLVAIDPLFRLARIRDEKAYAETYGALGPLIDAARETGAHVLLLHHSGKSLRADPIDSPLGSTAIGGAVCTLIVLRRTEAYRTIQTVQRIGQDMPETVLQFDPETRRLSIGGTRFEADSEESQVRILEFLQGASEPQNQAQIRDGVEGQTRIIRAALTALVAAGKVKKSGDGTRGKPFVYEFWFSGSQDMAGTREPETEKAAHPRANIGGNVVPTFEQKPILVPDKRTGQKRDISGAESGADAMEF